MERGAQLGNKNGTKGKPWQKALERALSHEYGSAEEGLLIIAKQVVKAAAHQGDKDAWKEIGNRFDGLPKQIQEHTGADGRDLNIGVYLVSGPPGSVRVPPVAEADESG